MICELDFTIATLLVYWMTVDRGPFILGKFLCIIVPNDASIFLSQGCPKPKLLITWQLTHRRKGTITCICTKSWFVLSGSWWDMTKSDKTTGSRVCRRLQSTSHGPKRRRITREMWPANACNLGAWEPALGSLPSPATTKEIFTILTANAYEALIEVDFGVLRWFVS